MSICEYVFRFIAGTHSFAADWDLAGLIAYAVSAFDHSVPVEQAIDTFIESE